MDTQHYDDIIIGCGKAGKTLAPALVADGRKTALVERSLNIREFDGAKKRQEVVQVNLLGKYQSTVFWANRCKQPVQPSD